MQPVQGSRSELISPAFPVLVELSDAEWRALITDRPNLLLAGEVSATEQMLPALAPYLVQPLCSWRAPADLRLPHDYRGSLLLVEVSALLPEQQSDLLEWLRASPERMQVVSTTARPLLTLVEQGHFRADLYYRLNTMRVECTIADRGV